MGGEKTLEMTKKIRYPTASYYLSCPSTKWWSIDAIKRVRRADFNGTYSSNIA